MFADQALVAAAGSFGWSGVDLFFVLSGYLIASQLFAGHATTGNIGLGRFYGRRFLRTLPAYLAVLALYFSVPAFTDRSALPPLWKFVTFTQNLSMVLWSQAAFSHAWSLCVEEHFYLLLPLSCLLLLRPRWRRAGPWVLGALFIAGPTLRAALWLRHVGSLGPGAERTREWYRLIYYPTWTRLDGLVAGVAIAAFVRHCPTAAARIGRHPGKIVLLGLALLGAAAVCSVDQQGFLASVIGFPAWSLGYGALVLSALGPRALLGRFDSRAARFLAAVSYPLYLTHKSIVHLTLGALDGRLDPDGLPAFAACCLTAIAGAAALHLAVERPALRVRERWLSGRAPPRLAGASLDENIHG